MSRVSKHKSVVTVSRSPARMVRCEEDGAVQHRSAPLTYWLVCPFRPARPVVRHWRMWAERLREAAGGGCFGLGRGAGQEPRVALPFTVRGEVCRARGAGEDCQGVKQTAKRPARTVPSRAGFKEGSGHILVIDPKKPSCLS